MFQSWDWIRSFDGKNNDWVKCLPGCKKHFYSTEAKKALFEMNLINHPDELKDAHPENHRLCRILVEKHAGQRCSIISSVSTSNMAQHIVRKFKDAPGLVTLFRYVHLHHITSHHITLLYITLHYITLHKHKYTSSKVAWLQLKSESRSTLNQKGGGFVSEHSPLPVKPPVISTAGQNLNQYRFHGTNYANETEHEPGRYHQIISPRADYYKSMVRAAIEQRYKYINTFFIFHFCSNILLSSLLALSVVFYVIINIIVITDINGLSFTSSSFTASSIPSSCNNIISA